MAISCSTGKDIMDAWEEGYSEGKKEAQAEIVKLKSQIAKLEIEIDELHAEKECADK